MCEQLIEEYPDRADLWLLQANAYLGLNQPLKAAENYEFVNQLGQSTADSLNKLGDIYINAELYEMAADTYIRAMEIDQEDNTERAIRSAKILAARGELEETRKLIEYIERIFGDTLQTNQRKDLLKLHARIAVANGTADEELKVLMEIVDLDPLDGEALLLLGQHSERVNDTEKAIFYYERAEKIPEFEADALLRHAQLLVRNGKYTEALPLLKRAQQIKPRENVQNYLEQIERLEKTR